MERKRKVIGIDPGGTGGISLFDVEDPDSYDVIPMPADNELVAMTLKKLFERWEVVLVACEKSQSMPGNAAQSMYNYGEHNGYIKAVCVVCGVPIVLFTSQTWQKTVTGLVPPDKPKKPDMKGMSKVEIKAAEKAHKAALASRRKKIKSNSLTIARQRYPKVADKIKHANKDGLADALHIGRYGLSIYKER